MIIVTGGAGFIGSNIVKGLNQQGISNILVVDDLSDGKKFINISQYQIADYLDKTEFLQRITANKTFAEKVTGIFHQGACSDTQEWNGQYMLANNYEYSKHVLHYALQQQIPLVYASSAAIYGATTTFKEQPAYEKPLNVYGYSKLLFDQYVRRILPQAKTQIVGLRYFNVYGPNEQHKGNMASVVFHLNNQLKANGRVKLFAGCDGYGNGEQRRDFIYIDDVVNVNLWFLSQPTQSGIFNVGTGRSQPFNDLANAVINFHSKGEIEYIPFPDPLRGCYQSFTEADISALRAAGYDKPFANVAQGVNAYLDVLSS